MTLGSKLAQERKLKNLTQEQLAELLGVSRQAISKWESDLAFPETEKLLRLCELFDCSLDYLLRDAPRTAAQQPAPEPPARRIFRERKSAKTWRGLPLWHVARSAHGVIAIGLKARGVISIGLLSRGVVSVGLLSMGVFSLGTLSLGLAAYGAFALGLLSAGAICAGLVSAGAIALGVVSLGAIAVGDCSVGALAIGRTFALGDHAQAAIALGKTSAVGSAMQVIGDPTAAQLQQARDLLDAAHPAFLPLGWAKDIIKLFLH